MTTQKSPPFTCNLSQLKNLFRAAISVFGLRLRWPQLTDTPWSICALRPPCLGTKPKISLLKQAFSIDSISLLLRLFRGRGLPDDCKRFFGRQRYRHDLIVNGFFQNLLHLNARKLSQRPGGAHPDPF